MKGIEIYKLKYTPKNGKLKNDGSKEVHSLVFDGKQAEAACMYLNAEALKGVDLTQYVILALDEIMTWPFTVANLSDKIASIKDEFGLPNTKRFEVPKMAKYEDLVDILDMISIRFYCTSDEFPSTITSTAEEVRRAKQSVESSKLLLSGLLVSESSQRQTLKLTEEKIATEIKSILDNSVMCWKDEYPTINTITIYPKNNKCVVTFKTAHSLNAQIERELASFCSSLKYKNIKKAYNQRVIHFN